MPSDSDLLFGKIATQQSFCTRQQIEWCVAIQSTSKVPLPLGRILVNEGYLTEEQHSRILAIQRGNLKAPDPQHDRQEKEALLFGRLAVREGFLTQEEANDCLREQSKEGEKRALGEIMVARGYLTSSQVKLLLGRQEKKIMHCPACRLSFTVLTISKEKSILCPRCKGPLRDGKPTDSTRTDAEFATRTLQAAKKELPRAAQDPSRVIPPAAVRMKTQCVICDRAFEEALDSTGRVRCPHCHATFVPR